MSDHSRPSTLHFARELRDNSTPAEVKLWSVLRRLQLSGVRFRRQHAIGPFVVDFCAPRLKLVIEVDGGQHLDLKDYDLQRTAFLESRGYRVLRFWNNEVMQDLNGVAIVIERAIAEQVKIKDEQGLGRKENH